MIWLLRHGDAEEGSPDSERRLTEVGEQQARVAGAALAALGVRPQLCLSSPKTRAVDTARLLRESLNVEMKLEPALAGGSFDVGEITAGLGEVLLVGHDPDLSQAVRELTGALVQLKKGGIAAVEGNELKLLLRPQELQAIAR